MDLSKIHIDAKTHKSGRSLSPEKERCSSPILSGFNDEVEEIDATALKDLYENEKQINWQLNAKIKRLESELNLLKKNMIARK